SPELIRAGAERARVAGVFELDNIPAAVETDEGEILIEREVLANGKSRVHINGRLATLASLREMAAALGDIHGQHEQQDLFSSPTQLEMLDQFCGASEDRERLAELFAQYKDAGERLESLQRSEQEKLRLLDLWKFQSQEIAQARLRPGEDAGLEEEKRVLANLSRIQQAGGSAYEALYESAGSASAQLKAARRALEELSRFDGSLGRLAQSLDGARITIEEAAHELGQYLDKLEANPDRLSQIEDRLAT